MAEPLVRELDDVIRQTEQNLQALREMASIIVDGQRANDHLLGRMSGLVRYTQGRLVAADEPAQSDAAQISGADEPILTPEFQDMPQPPPLDETWAETISRLNHALNNPDATVPVETRQGAMPAAYGKVSTR